MKFIFVISFLLCQTVCLDINSNINIDSIYNEEVVTHKFGHIKNLSLNLKSEMKIGIISSEESGQLTYYPCTKEVIIEAENILIERPNGSEVYYMLAENVVWELNICHEHNGEVIACGNELD